MKRFIFLSAFFLLFTSGCIEKNRETEKKSSQTIIKSDNSELEEAKAISRKIFEGIEKVENQETTRAEFRAYAEPLQEKLNSLIVIMEEHEVKELERYRNELMDEMSITDTVSDAE